MGIIMARAENKKREDRIIMEIVVDCYDSDERAMGWYCYLESTLNFPFKARCTVERPISPLKFKDMVEVIDMPPDSECRHEMFVTIHWDGRKLAVPLAQLKPLRTATAATRQAVDDWLYWVEQGYEF
jgi:hypothetical protein